MKTAKNKKEDRNDLDLYLAALQTRFRPATSAQDTTHWFSTDDIVTAIQEHGSVSVKQIDVFQSLWSLGYKFGQRTGSQNCNFFWMFHEKEDK